MENEEQSANGNSHVSLNETTVETAIDFRSSNGENEVSRRPRGRPIGSKNKPKIPLIIPQDSANALRFHLFQISDGFDIVESLRIYAHRRQRGLCILSGTGSITNVRIKHSGSIGSVIFFPGKLEIISLSGTFLPAQANPAASELTAYLAGGPNQVIGGNVIGPVFACGAVRIVAASFGNTSYENLPLRDEMPVPENLEQQQQFLPMNPFWSTGRSTF